jgi:hypothetical protein
MKIRTGFVSNSSSSSFVLKKAFMSEDEEKEFYKKIEIISSKYDTIGETKNFFFGIIDYNEEFYNWIESKKFIGIEWS